MQPENYQKLPSIHIETNINGLNDDCLIAMFRYVDILDLYTLSQVSPRFGRIVQSFHSKSLLRMKLSNLNFDYFMSVIENVGQHIMTMIIKFDIIDKGKPSRLMKTIQKHCSATLKDLFIEQWRDMELQDIQQLLSGLRSIQLDNCSGLVQASVLNMQKQLEVLSLLDCDMEDDALEQIVKNTPNLRHLQIMQKSKNGYVGLPTALSALLNLQYLTLHSDCTQQIELSPLVDIKSLRSLTLAYYNGELHHNSVRATSEMLLRLLNGLKEHNHLEELVLHACRLNNLGYIAIGNIKSIRHLALRKHYWIDDSMCEMIVAANTKYRTIDLFDCIGLTNDGIISLLKKCPDLVTINLSWCAQLTTALLPMSYEVIACRPRTGSTFEMIFGGATRIRFVPGLLGPPDQDIMRLVFNPYLSIDCNPRHDIRDITEYFEGRQHRYSEQMKILSWKKAKYLSINGIPGLSNAVEKKLLSISYKAEMYEQRRCPSYFP